MKTNIPTSAAILHIISGTFLTIGAATLFAAGVVQTTANHKKTETK
ncbi:hypothetical protein [Lentilactobacillus sp. Marseille-Q4993]|nr:hypothetical protein [Lentilactobacillus sp. Marseille-Q4993]